MPPAKPLRRFDPLEAPQRPYPLCHAALVLLQRIIPVAGGTRTSRFPQLGAEGCGIGVLPLPPDSLRDKSADRTCGPQACFRRCLVVLLTEPDSDQSPSALNGAIAARRALSLLGPAHPHTNRAQFFRVCVCAASPSPVGPNDDLEGTFRDWYPHFRKEKVADFAPTSHAF